jgi:hypothetical protein
MAEKELKKKKATSSDGFEVKEAPPMRFFEPEEWYTGKFMDHETKDGKFGPYIVVKFKVLNGQCEDGKPAKGLHARCMMDATVAPGKKLFDWFKVFLGRDPKKGEKLKLATFYGKKYRIFIKDQKKKKGDVSGKRYQTIDTIKALKKATA